MAKKEEGHSTRGGNGHGPGNRYPLALSVPILLPCGLLRAAAKNEVRSGPVVLSPPPIPL